MNCFIDCATQPPSSEDRPPLTSIHLTRGPGSYFLALLLSSKMGRRNRRDMRRLDVLAYVFVAVIGVPAVASAQWVHYPTDGIPRKTDGKPDLTAPAPRLPDGHPDLSGVWHARQPRQCENTAGQSIPCGSEIGGSPLGGNLGRNLPGGTLPYQPWAANVFQERHATLSIDDPHVRCLPDNPPRSWTLPHLTKAVHTPKLLVLLYEVNAMSRQVFIDGRPMPQDQNPSWTGYSTARWEGETSVVRTPGLTTDLW